MAVMMEAGKGVVAMQARLHHDSHHHLIAGDHHLVACT
jgi:hypothetical protein